MLRRALGIVLLLAGCGDNVTVTPPDAAPPDAPPPPPDAALCSGAEVPCDGTCVDPATDEQNCGGCGVACQGGAVCGGTCTCPTNLIPATIEPSGFDQFQGAGPITVAISPNFGAGINPLIIGYSGSTALDTDFDLATIPLGQTPFVAAGVNFDINTMSLDATFVATAGTLRLTQRCDTEVIGTLTDVTFQGVGGGFTNPEIDPEGCTFTVASVAFHIASSPCAAVQ